MLRLLLEIGDLMEKFMNEPIVYNWTDKDVVKEYDACQDKKRVAKIYGISVKEVSAILNRKKD